MTLGKKIASLRNSRGMSQEDLAAALEVSRQSVSKWETDASLPTPDKLILISDLFHITLDELVRGDGTPPAAPEEVTYILREQQRSPRHMAGYILLGAGLVGFILGFLFSPELLGMGVCLAVCGVICLVGGRYTGILLGWFAVALLLLFPVLYVKRLGISRPIVKCLLCLPPLIMTVLTVRSVMRHRKGR